MTHRSLSLRLLLGVLLMLGAGTAPAAEGVLQISQACALAGCFDGDFPGWPVTINRPGSYRLTSNLDLTAVANPASARAVQIGEDGVTLDLNGFAVLGAITCTGEPVTSCSHAVGSGAGISANSRASIGNGSVSGFSVGLSCTDACRIADVTIAHNAGSGISTNNEGALVRDVISRSNGSYGIFSQGRIEDSVIEHNQGVGLFMNPRSIASGNVVRENGGNGVRCFTCLMVNNLVTSNGGFGVEVGSQASWSGNVFYGNSLGNTTGTSVLQLAPNRCGNVLCP